jgi:translation initiation factor IF-2
MRDPGGGAASGHQLVREGLARVRGRFTLPGIGVLARSQVLEGQISAPSFVRIGRQRQVVWTGRLRRLPAFLGGWGRASAGQECALAFEGFEDFQPGDSIESFRLEPGAG